MRMLSEKLNQKTIPSFLPWMVWSMAALLYCYENFLQVSLNVIGPGLLKDFHLSGTDLGILASFYFYTYTMMQVPVGILLDRYGPRLILVMASLLIGLGCLLFGFAQNFIVAALGRLLIGLGSAFPVVSCFKLASNWFSLEKFAFLSGLSITIGFSGSIFGEYPLAVLVDAFGWRANMISYSVIGLILSFFIWRTIYNTPSDYLKVDIIQKKILTQELSLKESLKRIIISRQNWLTAIYGSLMFAPTIVIGSSWGGLFMISAYHVNLSLAVGVVSALYLGWIIGGPLFGFISDKMGRRKPVLFTAAIGSLINLVIVLYINSFSIFTCGVFLFLFGLFSSGFLPAFSIIRESNPNNITGTALGFMNGMNGIGGVFAPYLIGMLLDIRQSSTMAAEQVYSLNDFHFALIILPIMLLLAFITLFFIKEPTSSHSNIDLTE